MSSTRPIHLSPFQKEKLEYYFNFLCPNENGYLDKGSIHRLMEKILDFTGWDENSPTVKKFMEVHNSFFEILFETAVEEEHMEGMVTLSRWLSMWSSLLPGAMGMHNLPIWLRLMPEILFKIVDKRGNGYIDANDLELFYKEMVHISPETAHQTALKAFDQMTDNGRYQLNETSYEQLFANFLIGRTPYGPGRYIFGVFEHEASITYSDTFKVTSCGTPDDPVVIKNVIVMPDPIVTPGKVIVTLTMEVKKLLFSPIELDIETQRQIGDRWVTMPCIYQFLGSCKYEDVCKLFLKAPPLCPKEVQRKFPCKCPVEPNVYQLDAMEVPLDYGDFIAGKYHSIVKGSNWMFNQLMCYIIDFEIVKVDRPT